MQDVSEYLLILVIGAIIGISVSIFALGYQAPDRREQMELIIHGINYVPEYSTLEIELLNNVPWIILEGNVTVYQGESWWTSEVLWNSYGHGTAEVLCESINETQNFRITYTENNTTYFDTTIEWNEIETAG